VRVTLVLVEIRISFPGFSGHYSEGVASLAAVTRQAGHECILLHLTQPLTPTALARRVRRTAPDLVGFTCTTHTFPYVRAFIPAVRNLLPEVPIILGGVHAMLNPESCLTVPGLDAACIGEGEQALISLLARIDAGASFADLAGFCVRDGDDIRRNPPLPLVEDLDSLPPPEHRIFDFKRLMPTREGVLYVFASRGCPYGCHFCCNTAIRARYPNRQHYVRFKSVERVCDEILTVTRDFPGQLRGIYFQDEILPMHPEWFARFIDLYPRSVGLPFNCNIRADMVTPALVDQLAAAGCRGVSIGLETGVDRLRNGILGKAITGDTYRRACELLRAANINITTFSMVGLPHETVDDALATVEMNVELRVDRTCISILCPYPGTRLHARCREEGILADELPDTYQDASPLCQQTISQRQVQFIHDYFGLLVKVARQPQYSLLRQALWRAIRRDDSRLSLLSWGKRQLIRLLCLPYLYAGRFLLNRQRRVFHR
jgi:anaerobic magnesium-protoporphyrin IX monomethyl ester cyclase